MYEYKAKYISNYDGDTIKFMADLGFGVWKHITVSLVGIDTPELRSKDPSAKERAYTAKDYVFSKLADAKEIIIKIQKDKTGKYGRYIADVVFDGTCLAEALVSDGLAVRKEY